MTYKEDELFELYLLENWEEIMDFNAFKKMFRQTIKQEQEDLKVENND